MWISGIHPARESLLARSSFIREMRVARDDRRVAELVETAMKLGISIRHERRDALTALLGHAHHQGIALHMTEFPYASLESLFDRPSGEHEPLVILDCIQDPRNLGAVLRCACFLGAAGVVSPRDRSARMTDAVMKAAAGAASYLPIVQVTNLVRTIEDLKGRGFWTAGLEVEGGKSIYDADLDAPLALVVGNEQKGLRPLVRRQCDFLVRIPASGPVQSLNAAAACAIALSEVQRRRIAKRGAPIS